MGRAVGSGEGGGEEEEEERSVSPPARSLGAVTVYSSSLCAVLASPCSIVGQSGKKRERRGHDLSPTKTVFHYFFCCFANAVVVVIVRYFGGAPNLHTGCLGRIAASPLHFRSEFH